MSGNGSADDYNTAVTLVISKTLGLLNTTAVSLTAKLADKRETREMFTEVKKMEKNKNNSLHDLDLDQDTVIRYLIEKQGSCWRQATFELLQNARDGILLAHKQCKKNLRLSLDIYDRGIVVSDNGIGMSKDDLLDNLRVLGKSSKSGSEFMGEFGLGFWKMASIADVTLFTRDYRVNIVRTGPKDRRSYKMEIVDNDFYFDGVQVRCSLDERLLARHQIEEFINTLDYFSLMLPKGTSFSINDEKVNAEKKLNTKEKIETDDYVFYPDVFSKSFSGIQVYNMGAHVTTEGTLGISGVLVSKKRLDVNFSRTVISSNCKLYKQIYSELKEFALNFYANTTMRLNSRQRSAITEMLCEEKVREHLYDVPCWEQTNGVLVSTRTLMETNRPIYCVENADQRADSMITTGEGYVFPDTLSSKLVWAEICYRTQAEFNTAMPPERLRLIRRIAELDFFKGIGSKDELSGKELTLYNKLMKYYGIACYINNKLFNTARELLPMQSSFMGACTDGSSTVYLNLVTAQMMVSSKASFSNNAFYTLTHEYTHDSSNEDTDVHGPGFYEEFHKKLFRFQHKFAEIQQELFSMSWKSIIQLAEYELSKLE